MADLVQGHSVDFGGASGVVSVDRMARCVDLSITEGAVEDQKTAYVHSLRIV